MSRHNRRRTRPVRYSCGILVSPTNFDLPTRCLAESCDLDRLAPPLQTFVRRGDASAQHWHNRFVAWKNRERRQREERQQLMEERKRLFGGESEEGDESGLCSKMLEYFEGLDYIEM